MEVVICGMPPQKGIWSSENTKLDTTLALELLFLISGMILAMLTVKTSFDSFLLQLTFYIVSGTQLRKSAF